MQTTNPRRAVLAQLKALKQWATQIRSIWSQPLTIHELDPQGNWKRRHLRPHEKRENSVDRWDQLIQYMQSIIDKAQEIQEYARERREEVRRGKRW